MNIDTEVLHKQLVEQKEKFERTAGAMFETMIDAGGGGLAVAKLERPDGKIEGALIYVAGVTTLETLEAIQEVQTKFEAGVISRREVSEPEGILGKPMAEKAELSKLGKLKEIIDVGNRAGGNKMRAMLNIAKRRKGMN